MAPPSKRGQYMKQLQRRDNRPIPYSTWKRWYDSGRISAEQLAELGIYPTKRRWKKNQQNVRQAEVPVPAAYSTATSDGVGGADSENVEDNIAEDNGEHFEKDSLTSSSHVTSSVAFTEPVSDSSDSVSVSSRNSETASDWATASSSATLFQARTPSSGSHSEEDDDMMLRSEHDKIVYDLRQKYVHAKNKLKKKEFELHILDTKYDQLMINLVAGKYAPSECAKCRANQNSQSPVWQVTMRTAVTPVVPRETAPRAAPASVPPPAAPLVSTQDRPAVSAEGNSVVAVAEAPDVAADGQGSVPAADIQIPAEPGVPVVVAEDEHVIYENGTTRVVIDKKAAEPRFLTFISGPMGTYGMAGDGPFVQKATAAMWTEDVLKVRTLTGKLSNKEKKDNPNKIPDPPLEPFKVLAIREALRVRVLKELQAGPPAGVSQEETKFAERVTDSIVHYYIGRVIFNVKRKGKPRPPKKTQQQQQQQPEDERPAQGNEQ